MESDPILRELMAWAVNIVRLPLKAGAHEALASQIRDFPPEFLLFVEHVSELVLQDDNQEDARSFSLRREDHLFVLYNGSSTNPVVAHKGYSRAFLLMPEVIGEVWTMRTKFRFGGRRLSIG